MKEEELRPVSASCSTSVFSGHTSLGYEDCGFYLQYDGPTSTGGTLSGARAAGAFRGGSPLRAGMGLPPASLTRGARPSPGT